MLSLLNTLWLEEKGTPLEGGKKKKQRRVDFFFFYHNFLYVLGSGVGKTRLSFF